MLLALVKREVLEISDAVFDIDRRPVITKLYAVYDGPRRQQTIFKPVLDRQYFSDKIKDGRDHNGDKARQRQNDKKQRDIEFYRVALPVREQMNFIFGQILICVGMAIYIGAGLQPVCRIHGRARIFLAMHGVN